MGLEDFEKDLAEQQRRVQGEEEVEESSSTKHNTTSRQHQGHHDRDHHREDKRDRESRRHRHHHSSHHRSHRHRDDVDGDGDDNEERRRHRHKRHRENRDDDEERHRRKRRRSSASDSPQAPHKSKVEEKEVKVFDSDDSNGEGEEDEWVEKEAMTAPPTEDILDQRDAQHTKPTSSLSSTAVQRDAWMQEPSALDIDYMQSRRAKAPPTSQFVNASVENNHEFKVHAAEVSQHLADLQRDFDSDGDEEEQATAGAAVVDEPAQHGVDYTFGDSGSSWRMTKLKAVYRQAEESKRSIDDVALERYGDLRDFDDAREEEREMDRRKMYGKEYVGLEKPSGELFQERKMKAGIRRESSNNTKDTASALAAQGTALSNSQPPIKTTAPLNATALNKLKAQMMKAKLRNSPNAAQLEEEYKLAEAASLANTHQPDVIVLNSMENRMLAGGRGSEVTARSGKRNLERGVVEENEDMSISDMIRQERRNRDIPGGSESLAFAERIAKDTKFIDNLEYMDENATKLSQKVTRSDVHLRGSAINEFQKMQKILDSCPFCHHEDRPGDQSLPAAPIVSLGTRTYLTLPTEPELSPPEGNPGADLVPITHHRNLLECDDDEWEELRNFMKSLTRHYDAQGAGVIFYENAAHSQQKHHHAVLHAVPLPYHLLDTAPAYFKEAILAAAEQWSQHRPIIDTTGANAAGGSSTGGSKWSFRKSMSKSLPYFHVFFTLDGGMGHVVEDPQKWPRGDLFAREVLGGMLDLPVEVIKSKKTHSQGRFGGGGDRNSKREGKRVEGFRKNWKNWDWTRELVVVD